MSICVKICVFLPHEARSTSQLASFANDHNDPAKENRMNNGQNSKKRRRKEKLTVAAENSAQVWHRHPFAQGVTSCCGVHRRGCRCRAQAGTSSGVLSCCRQQIFRNFPHPPRLPPLFLSLHLFVAGSSFHASLKMSNFHSPVRHSTLPDRQVHAEGNREKLLPSSIAGIQSKLAFVCT